MKPNVSPVAVQGASSLQTDSSHEPNRMFTWLSSRPQSHTGWSCWPSNQSRGWSGLPQETDSPWAQMGVISGDSLGDGDAVSLPGNLSWGKQGGWGARETAFSCFFPHSFFFGETKSTPWPGVHSSRRGRRHRKKSMGGATSFQEDRGFLGSQVPGLPQYSPPPSRPKITWTKATSSC